MTNLCVILSWYAVQEEITNCSCIPITKTEQENGFVLQFYLNLALLSDWNEKEYC